MNKIDIYTDGSFIKGKCGFGAVILENESVIHEFSGIVTDKSLLSHRQVSGEIAAVVESINWCITHNIKEVTIYYDYEGVAAWAKGIWKTNTPMTARYADFFKNCPMTIHWQKVKSHSGNKWNDYADKLAKNGTLSASKQKQTNPHDKSEKSEIPHETLSLLFSEYLQTENIETKQCGTMNNMFSRLEIGESVRDGIIDIYSKKSGPKIDLRAFSSIEKQMKIEQYWVYFIQNIYKK